MSHCCGADSVDVSSCNAKIYRIAATIWSSHQCAGALILRTLCVGLCLCADDFYARPTTKLQTRIAFGVVLFLTADRARLVIVCSLSRRCVDRPI